MRVRERQNMEQKSRTYFRAMQDDFRMGFDYFSSTRTVTAAEHWRYSWLIQ